MVVFFAHREANQRGSREIGTEHLLLGLLQADRRLARRVLGLGGFARRYITASSSMKSIRRNVSVSLQHSPVAQDLPLTVELRRVLKRAANEADRVGDQHIRSKHLLSRITWRGL